MTGEVIATIKLVVADPPRRRKAIAVTIHLTHPDGYRETIYLQEGDAMECRFKRKDEKKKK